MIVVVIIIILILWGVAVLEYKERGVGPRRCHIFEQIAGGVVLLFWWRTAPFGSRTRMNGSGQFFDIEWCEGLRFVVVTGFGRTIQEAATQIILLPASLGTGGMRRLGGALSSAAQCGKYHSLYLSLSIFGLALYKRSYAFRPVLSFQNSK